MFNIIQKPIWSLLIRLEQKVLVKICFLKNYVDESHETLLSRAYCSVLTTSLHLTHYKSTSFSALSSDQAPPISPHKNDS